MDAKPHKPVAAIAALFCLFNGALLYLITGEYSGDGKWGTDKNNTTESSQVIRAESDHFKTSKNTIYYQDKQLSFEAFCDIVVKLKKEERLPEIYFHFDTENGLYQKMINFLSKNDIGYREFFGSE